jgi:subtilisin family serine protease
LLLSSAGNEYLNLNEMAKKYPTDIGIHGEKVSDNFLLIGGTSQKLHKNLVYTYSNYGDKHVDVFAPGERLYVALPNNKYKYVSGTSLSSSLTAGVAALLYSYYPNLTVSQVKQIIIDSSVKYDVDVEIRVGREKKIVPFASLSKSGGIVNAYNALIMAEKIAN